MFMDLFIRYLGMIVLRRFIFVHITVYYADSSEMG